jgi:hypothetical protein
LYAVSITSAHNENKNSWQPWIPFFFFFFFSSTAEISAILPYLQVDAFLGPKFPAVMAATFWRGFPVM